MNNKLKNEMSPYLRQHAENPVEWYPWCEEAFEAAKKADKPIFLSIGYSTCHWCHVMAHESFENEKTAEILNRGFISIKVDREERPDIDSVYMSVCQAFTGSGGWPMSIFMTCDKRPFFAGTYFPVNSQFNLIGFSDLLNKIITHWNRNRSGLLQFAEQIISHLKQDATDKPNSLDENLIEKAFELYMNRFDHQNGGFGSAPKFPAPHNLLFLLLYAKQKHDAQALEMVEKTLLQMRKGGIFDHIGYGFSRYSTDQFFLAPHFEKMLYDNALLIIAYAAEYSFTQNSIYLDTAEKTAAYILCEMVSPNGGFYCSQDADSEGVEGKYYTFTLNEIIEVLGEEKGRRFAAAFDITKRGNFEGVNIPNLLNSKHFDMDFSEEKRRLYAYRKNRARLHLDDKILASWNSMMITALSILYRVSKKETYLHAAKKAQEFMECHLICEKQIYTSYHEGKVSKNGFLDDYAFYIAALMELYHSTLKSDYLNKAEKFCMETIKQFSDCENGGFFLCEAESNELFMNPKETYDSAIPSGNSMMAYNLVRLCQLTDNEKIRENAEKQLDFMSKQSQDYPAGNSMFLISKWLYDDPPAHITVACKSNSDLSSLTARLPFLANVLVKSKDKTYPLIHDKTTYYVCKNHVCLPPSNTMDF